MVHVRLNTQETNPNEYINFISSLPSFDSPSPEDARQLLRALAAQVKPVMKAHGFIVNSFEEYEYNTVFAGRNWNAGETIELVLRRPDGSFCPIPWLISTLCHELAHIKHMNHGPAFQALWSRLRAEVKALQSQGYCGDGFWSAGTRLADFQRVGGKGIALDELPEYLCGGAQSRARPTRRRRRTRQQVGPSNHTGAQIAKKRKAGGRVTAKDAFSGEGQALNEHIRDEVQKKAGTGFRKQAGSKRAREERALAIERRLAAIQHKSEPNVEPEELVDDSDSEIEELKESDQERRHTMLASMAEGELTDLKASATNFDDDFVLPSGPSAGGCSQSWTAPSGRSTDMSLLSPGHLVQRGKAEVLPRDDDVISISSGDGDHGEAAGETMLSSSTSQTSSGSNATINPLAAPSVEKTKSSRLNLRTIVQEEVEFRKKESMGLTGSRSSQVLGSGKKSLASWLTGQRLTGDHGQSDEWECQVCTLLNGSSYLACSTCSTPRGQYSWVGDAT